MVIEHKDETGEIIESFAVRAQNMHCCVRMAAKIFQSFYQSGPMTERPIPFDWESAWESVISLYEETYNPDRWCSVYHEGKSVFKTGRLHPLFDIVEKSAANSGKSYDDSMVIAENAFRKTGKNVSVDYDGNVALSIDLREEKSRCGIILRSAERTTTFSFSVIPQEERSINYTHCLIASAAFLEGIQLSFMVGQNNYKLETGRIAQGSDADKRTKLAQKRLKEISADIANLELASHVRYRPERPDFDKIIEDAERKAEQIATRASQA